MGREEAAYGDPRTFTEGSNTVKAIPFVGLDGMISRVVIIGMNGDREAVERMAADIKQLYVGALLSTWQTGCGTN